jgi:di/tricarboxylate transporter
VDIAHLVLASVGLLIALLASGRVAPAILFTGFAAAYYLTGLIDQRTLLASYTNPALATLILLLCVSLVLERSPWIQRLSDALLKGRPTVAIWRLGGFAGLCSAFLNNTAVVSALLGAVSRQHRLPASRLLLPLSYASILGGITTLVGTSTNLVVNSFVIGAGLPALGMFSFAAVGIPVALLCLLALPLSARLLPVRKTGDEENRQSYLLEARVVTGSPLAGRSIEANGLRNLDGLFLLEIARNDHLISPATPGEIVREDDVLVFTGAVRNIQALQRFPGLQVFGHHADALLGANLVEVVVSTESELDGKTLREVDFRTMFDAGVVGIRRGEKRLEGQLGRIPLRAGDSLLLAVGPDFAQHRNLDRNFRLVAGPALRPPLTNAQGRLALGGFAAVLAASAVGWLPLFDGLLVLLAVLLVRRLTTLSELRRRFPFELLMVIGSALAIARVIESSGAGLLIAQAMRATFDGFGVWGALVGVYLITLILTELVTNNAAAALAFPIGLSAAQAFGVDPMPFVMVVAYGASACFLMPSGYQTHLMVYSPGRYRLTDFLRAGLPISVLYSAGVLLLVPRVFPFAG